MGWGSAQSDARHALSARSGGSTTRKIASVGVLGVVVLVGVAVVASRPSLISFSRGVISAVSLLSSACISSQAASCDVKVPGGFLTLSNIQFPDGKEKAGTADAIGTVHGQAVQGTVKVTAEDSFKVKKEDDPEATWIPTIPGDGNSNETGTFRVLDSQNGVLDSQYEKAMNAMIHNLKARQAAANKVMTDEAATAVGKALTSSLVSSTIAKMALSVAEARYKQAGSDLQAAPPSPPSSSLASSSALPPILSQLPPPSLPHAAPPSASLPRASSSTQTLRQQQSPSSSSSSLAEAAAAAAASDAPTPTMGEGGGGKAFTGLPQLASDTMDANPAADGQLGPAAGHWGGNDCEGCTLCPECCASGWIPGCGGYKEELGGKWGRGATVGDDLQSRYAFDQSEAANIDRRLDGQYQQVMGQFLAGREQQRRRAVVERLKDKRREKMVREREAVEQHRDALAQQYRDAQKLSMQSVRDAPAPELADPWRAFRSYQTQQIGHDPRLSAMHS